MSHYDTLKSSLLASPKTWMITKRDKNFMRNRAILTYFILILLLISCPASNSYAGDILEDLGAVFIAHFDKSIAIDKPKVSKIERIGGKIISDGVTRGALYLGTREYLAIDCRDLIQSKSGTLMFWVRPHWKYYNKEGNNRISHSFVSWTWDDKKKGYFVLSDGWWEPAGAYYTYMVANNQDYSHEHKPIFFKKGEWIHFACVWKSGNPGVIKLYRNGRLIAKRNKFSNNLFGAASALYLGSDQGTSQTNNRWADSDFDEVALFNRELSDEEIVSIYEQQNTHELERNISSCGEDLSQPYIPQKDAAGNILETRAIFDEGVGWVSEKGALETIRRIKKAGFNVYIPCVWHGKGARYPTTLSVSEDGLDFRNSDPLRRLITIAHENGIEVHPWFCVALRQREFLPEFYSRETPQRAFDVHRPQFREFITRLVLDVVKRYEVDGVLLDYIRTMGICTCRYCVHAYRELYGRNLYDDMHRKSSKGGLEPHLQQWQDNAIELIVSRIAKEGKKLKPYLIVSVYGHPTPSILPPSTQGRREIKWANKGLIDVIYNGEYSRTPDFEKHQRVKEELKNPSKLIMLLGNYERTIKGKVIPRNANLLVKLVSCSQRIFPGGIGIYLYSMLNDDQIEKFVEEDFHTKSIPHWKITRINN